jgi:hypothetical protein
MYYVKASFIYNGFLLLVRKELGIIGWCLERDLGIVVKLKGNMELGYIIL